MNAIDFLNDAFPDTNAKEGQIVAREQIVASAEEAIRDFLAFGGVGWLCTTASAEIRRILPGTAQENVTGYPLCGELANGKSSLHLQSAGDGWRLITLAEQSAHAAEDVILEETLLGRDRGGGLRYAVYWTAQDVCGQNEIRPVCFRFLGFESK